MTAPTTDTKPPKTPDPVVQRIAAALGETATQPLAHITRIVGLWDRSGPWGCSCRP